MTEVSAEQEDEGVYCRCNRYSLSGGSDQTVAVRYSCNCRWEILYYSMTDSINTRSVYNSY